MNVLVLGSDPRNESILRALTNDPRQRVERLTESTVSKTDVSVADFDALICAGPVRPVLNRIREFLADGKLVMIIPSAAQGSEAAYELLAIDEESGGRLAAGFPHRYLTAWRELQERIQNGTEAELKLIQIERRLPGTAIPGVVPYVDVDDLLLSDADLLRWLGADFTDVTCLYAGATESGVTRATVTLAGDATSEATWSLEAHAAREECRVSVTAGGSSCSVNGPGARPETAAECAAGLLADLEGVLAGQPPGATWLDAVRAFDVVDAARRSVRRRRTVEISAGEVSERGQFKTKMTALGCTLLSLTLVGVVLALVIGTVFDPRDVMQRQSEAAGLVLTRDAFTPGTAELTGESQLRLENDPSFLLRDTPAAIIVEAGSSDGHVALDEERRSAVVALLLEKRGLDADSRVVVRPLAGRGFRQFMTGLWIVVFLPVGVFLILQALILVTRTPDGRAGS